MNDEGGFVDESTSKSAGVYTFKECGLLDIII